MSADTFPQCPYCPSRYSTRWEYERHVRTCPHATTPPAEPTSEGWQEANTLTALETLIERLEDGGDRDEGRELLATLRTTIEEQRAEIERLTNPAEYSRIRARPEVFADGRWRDNDCNAVTFEWGEPLDDGTYVLTATVHYDDNPRTTLTQQVDRMRAVVEAVRRAKHNLHRLGALSSAEISRALATLDGDSK